MGRCSALNCSNSSSGNIASKRRRLFLFPKDDDRRELWLKNCGRCGTWVPGKYSVLCEDHFEEDQFEQHRQDGRKKLKPNAVPTIFNLSSPSKSRNCSKLKKVKSEPKKVTTNLNRGKGSSAEVLLSSSDEVEHDSEPSHTSPSTNNDDKASVEQETGRRPSRRAAREAAEKIYKSVQNYGITPKCDDPDVVNSLSPSKQVSSTQSTPRQRSSPIVTRQKSTPTPTPTTRQRSYQNIKVAPPSIDLIMECHEELLSTVQAEALLQAQLQYNMVMKTLRDLKANNVKIICASADDPV